MSEFAQRRRLVQAAALVAILVVAGTAISLRATGDGGSDALPASALGLAAIASEEPAIAFVSTAEGAAAGHLSAISASRHAAPPQHYRPECDRLATSSKYLVCLERTGNLLWPFRARLMTLDQSTIKEVVLEGVPSRTRISGDGRYFATTTFVTGDSYAAELFSTRTSIFDTGSENKTGENLETYELIINGESYRFNDTNIWGVTFVPGQDRFFATASTNGHRYLVDGDIKRKSMLVLRDNVECPSLSPDGLSLAYKKRVEEGQYPKWRFYLLDLLTNTERPLQEERSVDDQIAWLDDDTVMYAVQEEGRSDIWKLSIGGGPPELFIRDGKSPTAFRPSVSTAALDQPFDPSEKSHGRHQQQQLR
jgi:hypothetical protein